MSSKEEAINIADLLSIIRQIKVDLLALESRLLKFQDKED